MKKIFIKTIAAVSAVSVISLSGISVSAATADDVIGAAYAAGISDQYVQTLIGYLKSHDFTSAQYDMMLSAIGNIENIGDDIIKQNTGLTLDELRGGSSDSSDGNSSSSGTSGTTSTDKDSITSDSSWKDIIKDNMTNEQMLEAINSMVSVGKDMGYDITVEKKGDKNFLVTVKDADGNIQMVTPVGHVIDRTGMEITADAVPDTKAPVPGLSDPISAFGLAAVACTAGALILKKKNDEAGE